MVGLNGIFFNLIDLFFDLDNDNKMLVESNILQKIEKFWFKSDELFFFDDQIYGIIKEIMSLYGDDKRTLTQFKIAFNNNIFSIRINIE